MTVRQFEYNGQQLIDPDPSMSPDDVRQLYSAQYPALTNAVVHYPSQEGGKHEFKEKGKDTTQRVEFKTPIAKKG